MDREEALKKLLHYCNYQDRCEKEVITKLNSLELAQRFKELCSPQRLLRLLQFSAV